MEREVRTLWWLGQGMLMFLMTLPAWMNTLFIPLSTGLVGLHLLGAIYSQYIQEED